MNLELNVVRLRATSLALYKLASWRLDLYFFPNNPVPTLPKTEILNVMENSKNSSTSMTCWEIPVSGSVAYKFASFWQQALHFYTNLLSWIYQKAYNTLPWNQKWETISALLCLRLFFLFTQRFLIHFHAWTSTPTPIFWLTLTKKPHRRFYGDLKTSDSRTMLCVCGFSPHAYKSYLFSVIQAFTSMPLPWLPFPKTYVMLIMENQNVFGVTSCFVPLLPPCTHIQSTHSSIIRKLLENPVLRLHESKENDQGCHGDPK